MMLVGGWRLRIATTILLIHMFLFPALAHTPVRWARLGKIVLALGSLAAWALCIYVGPALTIAVTYVVGCWVLALTLTLRFAFKNFLQLPEIQPTGITAGGGAPNAVLMAHITDTHITVADDVARWDGGRGGSTHLREFTDLCTKLRPTYICVSGDMTDTGHPREWIRFAEQIRNCHGSSHVIVAPGNHDLSQYYGEVDQGKARRYIEFQAALNPSVHTASGKPLSALLVEASERVQPKLKATLDDIRAANRFFNRIGYSAQFFAGIPAPYYIKKANLFLEHKAYLAGRTPQDLEDMRRGYIYPDWLPVPDDFDWRTFAIEVLIDEWFQEVWDSLFPLCFTDSLNRAMFFVLNSTSLVSTSISDSAVGSVGQEQLRRLNTLLSKLPPKTRSVIVVSHHTPFRRPGEWRLPLPRPLYSRSGWKRASQLLSELAFLPHDAQQARSLLDSLAQTADRNQAANFFFLSGHRHRRSIGRIGRVLALEGGSLADGAAAAILCFCDNLVFIEEQTLLDSVRAPSTMH